MTENYDDHFFLVKLGLTSTLNAMQYVLHLQSDQLQNAQNSPYAKHHVFSAE